MKYRPVKWQVAEDCRIPLSRTFAFYIPAGGITTPWIALTPDAVLLLREGWAWDGASGPTLDTPDTVRASAVHDALYWLIRHGHLPPVCRHMADLELYRLLVADGANEVRARVWYEAVEHFAASATNPTADLPVLETPAG